jgi:hypothetical protein
MVERELDDFETFVGYIVDYMDRTTANNPHEQPGR